MVGTLPVAPVQLPIFRNRTYIPFSHLDSSLGGLTFGKDGEGNYGYFGADGSLIPFNKVVEGEITTSTSNTTKITLGFKPKILIVWTFKNDNIYGSGTNVVHIYNENFSETKYLCAENNSIITSVSLPNTTAYRIGSIDNDGFTMNKIGGKEWRHSIYLAIR